MPTLSIIIPVHNDQRGIDSLLSALSTQQSQDNELEVIVVDNLSNPVITIQPSFRSFARVISCTIKGSYAARNAGVAASSGEILAFTDADCLPSSRWIEAGVNALKQHQEEHIIGGEVKIAAPSERTGTALYQYITGFQQKKNIDEKGFSITANIFCWRSTFNRIGNFDETLLSGGDRQWCWRAQRLGVEVCYSQEAYVSTPPRQHFASALRQARRVTAGRMMLLQYHSELCSQQELLPHRTSADSIRWILSHPELHGAEKLNVLITAIALKAATLIERIRLRLGASPEHR